MRYSLLVFLVLLTLVGCGRKAEPAAQAEPNLKPVPAQVVMQASPAQITEPPELAPEPRPALPSVETVKWMLRSATKFCGLDRTETAEERLIALGESAFPAYEAILGDRDSESLYVSQTCQFLSRIHTERRHFVPIALRRLVEPDAMVSSTAVFQETMVEGAYRWFGFRKDITYFDIALALLRSAAELRAESRRSAIWLLIAIGDEREEGAIVPFLSDDNAYTRYAAADAIAKIGGKRGLATLNACLKPGDPRRDANEMQYFKERRDELETRLKEHPIPKYLTN